MAVVVCLPRAGELDASPVALPVFGRYDGSGGVVELHEGDNAQRILAAFVRDLEEGRAHLDWGRLGIEPLPIEHMETLLALLSANVIHQCDAITWHGLSLGVALFEGNVAAALMQDEPLELLGTRVEDLPTAVLVQSHCVESIYAALHLAGPSLRCKYGLSFVALASLHAAMKKWAKPWSNAHAGYVRGETDPARFLAEAYRELSSDEGLLDALSEYSSQWGDEDEAEDQGEAD